MKKFKHIIWDWNGTLLNDAWVFVGVMNSLLKSRNLGQINLRDYRKYFGFPVIEYYKHLGFDFSKESFEDYGKDFIAIRPKNKSILPINITTATYPGFPTDLQAQWMALMTKADGISTITEEIYPDRFTHIAELSRFGAHIQLCENQAIIKGQENLKGAPVMSTDIRASASLILAALSAKGKSSISRIYHIDRGYEAIEDKFINLNADIIRVQE